MRANAVSYTHLDVYKRQAFDKARACKGKPTVIIAKTHKGQGVSFMEDEAGWHGKAPNDEQARQSMDELAAEEREGEQ